MTFAVCETKVYIKWRLVYIPSPIYKNLYEQNIIVNWIQAICTYLEQSSKQNSIQCKKKIYGSSNKWQTFKFICKDSAFPSRLLFKYIILAEVQKWLCKFWLYWARLNVACANSDCFGRDSMLLVLILVVLGETQMLLVQILIVLGKTQCCWCKFWLFWVRLKYCWCKIWLSLVRLNVAGANSDCLGWDSMLLVQILIVLDETQCCWRKFWIYLSRANVVCANSANNGRESIMRCANIEYFGYFSCAIFTILAKTWLYLCNFWCYWLGLAVCV